MGNIRIDQLNADVPVFNNGELTIGGLKDIAELVLDTFGELTVTVFYSTDGSMTAYKQGVYLDGTYMIDDITKGLVLSRATAQHEAIDLLSELSEVLKSRLPEYGRTLVQEDLTCMISEDTPMKVGSKFQGEVAGVPVEILIANGELIILTSTAGLDWDDYDEEVRFETKIINWIITDYLKGTTYDDIYRVIF